MGSVCARYGNGNMRMRSLIGHTIRATAACALLVVAGPCMDVVRAAGRPGTAQRGRVIYNLDCSEFYVGTFGPVVPETIDKFVDEHAAAGVSDLFINVNAQRTNYRSQVWEALWDGYDPTLSDEQPFFAGLDPKRRFETAFFKATLKLHQMGCDYPQRMIDRARHNQIKAWISLRMNDGHNGHLTDHPSHNKLWKSHPEWRLAYGLDYEQPDVREYYLKLVREICDRYDIDGLELDFVRFWLYFREGRQHLGVPLITAFIEEVHRAVRAAEQRVGHPVKLCVRVPSTPWIAKRHGLDAVTWAKTGLVDLIVVSPFWPSVDSDVPIETWKGLLIGTNVPIAVGLESGMHSGVANRVVTPEELRGVIASGLHRGADAVYFFNLFTSPYQRWPRVQHDSVIRDSGSLTALRAAPRRHPVTIKRPWAEGEPAKARWLPHQGSGTFRIHIGPRPRANQRTRVELVAVDHDQPLGVRLNGIACDSMGRMVPEHITAAGLEGPGDARHVYEAPAAAVSEGYNLIEITAPQHVEITWLEISVR